MPPKKLNGTEITSAQGQEMTRKVSARRIHSPKGCWNTSGGTRASKTAANTTAGV